MNDISPYSGLQASEVEYPLSREGRILSAQEAMSSELLHTSLRFYTIPPSGFKERDGRDYWRRNEPMPYTGLLLPSLWLPNLGVYYSFFRHLIDEETSSWLVPAIFGQVRIGQVDHRFKYPPTKLEEIIQKQVDSRLNEIIAHDFTRIMLGQYPEQFARSVSCTLNSSEEKLIEVPIIPERVKDKFSLLTNLFRPDPHKRGKPENLRVGRVRITGAQLRRSLPG